MKIIFLIEINGERKQHYVQRIFWSEKKMILNLHQQTRQVNKNKNKFIPDREP